MKASVLVTGGFQAFGISVVGSEGERMLNRVFSSENRRMDDEPLEPKIAIYLLDLHSGDSLLASPS